MQRLEHAHHGIEEVIAKESRVELQWVHHGAVQDPGNRKQGRTVNPAGGGQAGGQVTAGRRDAGCGAAADSPEGQDDQAGDDEDDGEDDEDVVAGVFPSRVVEHLG